MIKNRKISIIMATMALCGSINIQNVSSAMSDTNTEDNNAFELILENGNEELSPEYTDESSSYNPNTFTTKPRSINPVRYRKKNVKKTTEYGAFKRQTDTLIAQKDQSINGSKTVDILFKGSISGEIKGLNISLSVDYRYAQTINYTIPKGKKGYLAVRPVYSVERGTREIYNAENGKILGKNQYTVKKVVRAEYKVIYV